MTAYRYTEHANGLLATMEVDGPLANDTVTSTWSSAGDLLSVRDGMGQLTTYAQHNGLGQPGRITGSNGEVTDIAYDARGRVVATMKHVDGVAQATRVTFTDAGLPASVRTPDGRERRFVYDAALRLVEEYERQPDGLYARQRTAYNVSFPRRA